MKKLYTLIFIFISYSLGAQTINSIEGSANCADKSFCSASTRSMVVEAQTGFAGTVNLINANVNIDAIDSDPLFVDQVNGNFKLSATSPAINAGSNDLIPAGILTDLNGNQRVFNSIVDLGCYEFNNLTGMNFVTVDAEIQIYPNPTTDKLTITSKSFLQKIELFDITGKSVLVKPVDGDLNIITINVSQLNKGLYLLKAADSIQKVIIR